MKFRNLFWALILIAIGFLFMVSNFGWIDFHWVSIWRLWPLILIFWGISILPIKDIIKFSLVIAFIALTFIFFNQITEPRWYFTLSDHSWTWNDSWDVEWDDEGSESRTYTYSKQELTVPFDSATPKAILKMDAAAGNFYVRGETSELLSFQKKGDIGDYSMTTEESDGKTIINISLKKNKKIRRVRKNRIDIRLNQHVAWDLDFDVGAAAVEMDLSDYKIDTARIDAGAASLELKLGNLNPLTYIHYSSGAASLKIRIPKESACKIHSESILVSREFHGFNKLGDGVYQTENYPEGTNKIIIDIESAVSSLKVVRY